MNKQKLVKSLEEALEKVKGFEENQPILGMIDEEEGYSDGFKFLSYLDFTIDSNVENANFISIDIGFED